MYFFKNNFIKTNINIVTSIKKIEKVHSKFLVITYIFIYILICYQSQL